MLYRFTILAVLLFLAGCFTQENAQLEWRVYGGDHASSQHSVLDQINRQNVGQLEVAWVYRTGDAGDDDRTQIQANPIIVRGVLYSTSPGLKAFAVDAATGDELWSFDPFSHGSETHRLGVNRGVVYWEDGEDRRILFTAGSKLHAIDANTGRSIPTFGVNGTADLKEGLGWDASDLYVLSNTPGVVFENLLILGTRVSEGPDAAPGHIRAYDVRTGEIVWTFHTIPQPGQFGYDKWQDDAWKRIGGANSWTGMSLDKERGMVFIPTGSAAPDFYGGDRKGSNLFANSILALKARTGERVWHFQAVHHDLWDRDLPATPNLVTVQHGGRRIDAVAQITKSGHVFLLDRETGDPLFPVTEHPVPLSDLIEEEAWPTQPLPDLPPPFARQIFTESDVTDISPESHTYVLERFKQIRSGGQFVPPSLEGTVIFPGFDGGGEWGGAAVDPSTSILYVNSNEMPWILTMVEVPGEDRPSVTVGERVYTVYCAACHGIDRRGDAQKTFPSLLNVDQRLSRDSVHKVLDTGRGLMPAFRHISGNERDAIVSFLFGSENPGMDLPASTETPGKPATTRYAHTGYNRFLDPEGYPAVKPPWGTLNAIDLNRGEILWTVTLGEFAELTERGIPQTGTENYGGPIVTAGGLIFIGATKDEKFRAFDQDSGELLWETDLPAGGYATPATYQVGERQYVVIAAGGGKMGTKSGDAYVAFALPE